MNQMLEMTCAKHARGIKFLNMLTSMLPCTSGIYLKYD